MHASGLLQIWDANVPEDYAAWLAHWASWPKREVFAHPGYVRLFAGVNGQALCASFRLADKTEILYPFILKPIASGWSDISSPYGYGGPYCWNTRDAEAIAPEFWRVFDDWAASKCVVSEFVRFTLFPDDVLPYPGERLQRSYNVVRSLDMDDSSMWMDVAHKVRKNVKKALRSGITIEFDEAGGSLESFLRLYHGTMDRRSAGSSYYFERAFFEAIHRDLAGQFAYVNAVLDSRIVSTELALVSADSVYSYLGGTDSSAFDLRPNDLLKYEIIQWARERGKLCYVLGGGRYPDDGIYKYKLSFAPGGMVPFTTGQRILDEEQYRVLTNRRRAEFQAHGLSWLDNVHFFPAYRLESTALGVQ